MEKRRVSDYIILGSRVDWLMSRGKGARICGNGYVAGELRALERHLGRLGLHVTLRALEIRSVSEIVGELLAIEDETVTLSAVQAKALQRGLSHVQSTLVAETGGAFAYVVTDKRIASEKLLGDMASLFDDGAFESLPAVAQRDLIGAGRAIAFEMPTAAVFHLMRALEAVLRDFYCAVVKQKRIAEPRMWGPIITHLRQRKTNPPPAALLDHYDQIRRNFRNPTQHPEAEYDMNEAQNLLSLAVDAISRAAAAHPSWRARPAVDGVPPG